MMTTTKMMMMMIIGSPFLLYRCSGSQHEPAWLPSIHIVAFSRSLNILSSLRTRCEASFTLLGLLPLTTLLFLAALRTPIIGTALIPSYGNTPNPPCLGLRV